MITSEDEKRLNGMESISFLVRRRVLRRLFFRRLGGGVSRCDWVDGWIDRGLGESYLSFASPLIEHESYLSRPAFAISTFHFRLSV